MTTRYDARCTRDNAANGTHQLTFEVDDSEAQFTIQPSDSEYIRLLKESDNIGRGEKGVGWVPAVQDNGWKIDWDSLSTYTRK